VSTRREGEAIVSNQTMRICGNCKSWEPDSLRRYELGQCQRRGAQYPFPKQSDEGPEWSTGRRDATRCPRFEPIREARL
jgi:hypothetical protein